MGHGIDPPSAPQRSGRRRLSTALRTLPAAVERRIDTHDQEAHGRRAPRPEGGARLEEMVHRTRRTGST